MKFSAWQTSDKLPKGSEAHFWKASKCLYEHSVSLCWLLVSNKTLSVADDKAPRCSVCEEMERGR